MTHLHPATAQIRTLNGFPAFSIGRLTTPSVIAPATVAWKIVAYIAVALCIGLSVGMALSATEPVFPFDEVHQLAMSRMLAGYEVFPVRGAGYYPGWAVLLTPFWWIFETQERVFIAASVLGVILSTLTIVPLAAIARRFRLDWAQAITASAVVMILPARLVQNNYLLSERLFVLAIILVALAVFRLWENPTHVRALVFGIAIGAAYFVHLRGLVIVLASAVWALALFRKRASVALASILSLTAFGAFAKLVGDHLNALLLAGGQTSQADGLTKGIAEMRIGNVVRVLTGEGWAQFVGSYGLFVIGVIALMYLVLRELRRGVFGRATWIFGALAASWIASLLTWALDSRLYFASWVRLDAWIYGRYIEPITALVCLIGAALLIRGLRAWFAWLSVALAALLSVIVLFWIAPAAPTGGHVTPAHIGGILPWSGLLPDDDVWPQVLPSLTNVNSFWLIASLSGLLCLVIVAVSRKRSLVTIPLLLLAILAGTVGTFGAVNDFRVAETAVSRDVPSVRAIVEANPDATLAWDGGCRREGYASGVGQNYLGYGLIETPSQYEVFSTTRDGALPNEADIVLTCDGNELARGIGATQFVGLDLFDSEMWLLGGVDTDVARATE